MKQGIGNMIDPTEQLIEDLETIIDFYKDHDWCRGFYARREDGSQCYSDNPEAKSFCIVGAKTKAIGSTSAGPESEVRHNNIMNALKGVCGQNIVEWNDRIARTKEEVVQLLGDTLSTIKEQQSAINDSK